MDEIEHYRDIIIAAGWRGGKTYLNEMYGQWLQPTERELQLQALAEQYHRACQEHEQVMDRYPYQDVLVDKQQSMNLYALTAQRHALCAGMERGFTEQEVMQAIRNYVKGNKNNEQ